jgi:methionyl-tRNA formyltransferase
MKIVFMGTPEFAVPSLKALIDNGYDVRAVVTQPDKPKGRGNKLASPPVKELALSYGIDVLQPEKVKTEDFVNKLKEYEPDLLVTAAYGKILSKATLDVPPLGCINVHASLLPKYRGAAPLWWVVINGEKETGITTMFTDAGMDTGDMLLKKTYPVNDEITTSELSEILADLGAELLIETLDKLKDGTLQRIPQDSTEATYAPMIDKNVALINWTKSAKAIHNLVRGTNSWPVALTNYEGQRMKVWKSRVVNDSEIQEMFPEHAHGYDGIFPGTILTANKGGIYVMSGDGILQILEVQFDSSKRMSVKDYLTGHSVESGVVLS